MKMRASLLQFAITLAAILSIAIASLVFARHNLAAQTQLQTQSADSRLSSQIRAKYGQLPLKFEANRGQTAPEVQFLSHGYGYELFLTRQDAVLALRHSAYVTPSSSRAAYLKELRNADRTAKTSVLRVHFADANSNADVQGIDRLPGRTDYFIGSDPKNWRTGVPSYAQVAYHSLYPGIDAVFYGNQRQIEYDFRVSPGASPRQIAFNVEGASSLRTDASGNLVLDVAGGQVMLMKPVVYQEESGKRQEIAANYSVGSDNRVTFSMGGYDTTKPLIIDPVLNYSTYLGGSAGGGQFGPDSGNGIAVDASGDAYIVGETSSISFPTKNGYTISPLASNANGAVFVTELNPTGTAEVYSTYLIGTDAKGEDGLAVALDPTGNIYVTGATLSSGFPLTPNAAEGTAPANVAVNGTGFVSKINPSATGLGSLVYSSYLGGSGGDVGTGIAADANNNAYVVGVTASTDFLSTVTNASGYQVSNPEPTPTNGAAFLAVVNTGVSGAATYATYLGGNGTNAATAQYGDEALGVTVDSSQNAYVVGSTSSTNFPTTTSALQTGANASNPKAEAFVSVFNTTKTGTSSLTYSTYLGGEVFDIATGVALEPGNTTPSNAVYVTGQTQSSQFPTTSGAYISTASVSSGLIFVTLLDTTQSGNASLKYSALVGGSGGDEGNGIAVDTLGNAYVAGTTGSTTDFPVTPGAFQTANNNGSGTAFVLELNPGGNASADLLYATFFGGSGTNGGDLGLGIALDPSKNAYITGSTGSPSNFTVSTGAFQTTLTGSDASATAAAFVVELTLQPTLSFSGTTLAFGNDPVGTLLTSCGALSPCVLTLTNNTNVAIPITVGAITPTGTGFVVGAPSCTASVVPGTACMITVTFTPTAAGAELGTLPISYTAGNNTVASTQNITLTGTGTNFTVAPSALTFPFQLITSTSAAQTVTLTNTSAAALPFTATASAGFAESDTCSGSVPASGMCTLNVTFTPSAAGPATGTLTVAAGGVNETVQLTGNGGDFSVTMPASITVTNNSGSGSANLTATTGFTPSVSFSCTTTIPNGSCTAPTTTAPNSFTISVSVAAFVPPASQRLDGWRMMRPVVPVAAVILALLTVALSRRRRAWIGLAAMVVVFGVLGGCSGGNSGGAKTYSLTLTASSMSGSTTVSHPYTTPVTVQ